jgi:hypothetical protein
MLSAQERQGQGTLLIDNMDCATGCPMGTDKPRSLARTLPGVTNTARRAYCHGKYRAFCKALGINDCVKTAP